MMELIERFVVAVEKIAVALSAPIATGEKSINIIPPVPSSMEELAADADLPPAPPAPPVTEVPPVPGAPGSGSIVQELDARGFPWDGRIHTDAKTKVKKSGEWKLKRQIDPALVEAVKAEYTPMLDTPAPPAPTDPFPPADMPVPPAPPVPETTPGELTFPAFVKALTDAGYTGATAMPYLQKYDIGAVPQLAQNLPVMNKIAAEMGLV